MARRDLYRLTMTRDELRLLGVLVSVGADVFDVSLTPRTSEGFAVATTEAALRAVCDLNEIPDRVAVAQRLSKKLDPLLAEVAP